MNYNKYFLVGMPASGKSTIGKLLAGQIGLKFIDLDAIIVENEGMDITEIFKSKGEDYFREVERKYLQAQISSSGSFVMSTGGGAPCFFDNMVRMNEAGITIFLDISLDDLYGKLLKKGTQKRPLLKDISHADLYKELEAKLTYRKAYYEKSNICLSQNLGNIYDRVNEVVNAIEVLKEET